MKKTFILLCMAASCAVVNAQKVTVLPNDVVNGYVYIGSALSNNGKYIAGSDMSGGIFVADIQPGEVKWKAGEDKLGAELRGVTNDGLGCGYDGPALVFDFKTGISTFIDENESIAESITPDGKFIVGSADWEQGFITHPRLWRRGDDGTYVKETLCEPNNSYLGYNSLGGSARFISADGSMIVGDLCYGILYPAVSWFLNSDDTSYSVFPISHRFLNLTDGDSRPYIKFQAAGLSSNGKWIAVELTDKDSKTGTSIFGRYNTETEVLELPEFDPSVTSLTADYDEGFMAYKIADDGTMVFVAGSTNGTRIPGIWKAGEKSPRLLSEEYPEATEIAKYDENLYNTPVDITPDARYILLVGTVDYSGMPLYETYLLDTQAEGTGVEEINTEKSADLSNVKRYTIDGRRTSTPVSGVNIVVGPSGKARKVLVK